jgi:hypothetical protein
VCIDQAIRIGDRSIDSGHIWLIATGIISKRTHE